MPTARATASGAYLANRAGLASNFVLLGNRFTGELLGGGGGGGGSAARINNELYDGKVDNGAVSFYVWRGTDTPYKVTYKGTLNAAGDEMSLTVTGLPGRGGTPPAPQTVTARCVE